MKLKNRLKRKWFYLSVILATLSATWAVDAEMNADEIMKKSHLAFFYAGDDGIADVTMTIVNSKGKERRREFTMLRLDVEDGGKQFFYTYFRKPSDVSRLTFMVHKIPFANDNRWLYIPSLDLVRRLSADDKNSSFVGSDFTYEDVSGRHWTEDNHRLLRRDTLNGRDVYVIESIPKKPYKGFARKISYIDSQNFLPLKEEYYNKKDKLARVMTLEKIETIEDIPTATVRKMENVKKKQYTIVEFSNIVYNVGIKENIFTERYLKNPPREYIK
jgi:outer membrane lipoprotein-sorting protein